MKPFWMLSILVIIVIVLSGAGCVTQSTSANQTIDGITIPTTTGSPTPAEARQIATAAYVFGYSLVVDNAVKDANDSAGAAGQWCGTDQRDLDVDHTIDTTNTDC